MDRKTSEEPINATLFFKEMAEAGKLGREISYRPMSGESGFQFVRGDKVVGELSRDWKERFQIAFSDSKFRYEIAAEELNAGRQIPFIDMQDRVASYFEDLERKKEGR